MMKSLLLWLTRRLPEPRVIYDREGGSPYLSRWYLLRRRPPDHEDLKGQAVQDDVGRSRRFDLYLHQFHRSDDDLTLHNHPWSWALSFVLCGGYSEERRVGDDVVRRKVWPFTFNFIRGEDYHRVDLFRQDAWTLFLVGPKVTTWYFWDRVRKVRSEWFKFIGNKRYGSDAEWESDVRDIDSLLEEAKKTVRVILDKAGHHEIACTVQWSEAKVSAFTRTDFVSRGEEVIEVKSDVFLNKAAWPHHRHHERQSVLKHEAAHVILHHEDRRGHGHCEKFYAVLRSLGGNDAGSFDPDFRDRVYLRFGFDEYVHPEDEVVEGDARVESIA